MPEQTDSSPERNPLLRLGGIQKSFGGVRALKGVDFELQAGEIHALLGENGAGKSTLIKVLGGIHIPDAGTILIDGGETRIRSVADADQYGIRIIHQELSLAPNLSAAENICLGREPHRWGFLRRGLMGHQAQRLLADLGMHEIRDVRATVSGMSMAQQQLVEIARALSTSARILVLDEPTSSLSEAETEALFATLRRLRNQGVGIIYISHRLEEIIRLADRITVLRDGESMGTQRTARVNQRELVRWMVGRDIADHFHRPAAAAGAMALEVTGLRNAAVHNVTFSVRHGEILGLAGLVGSGRTELVRALFGIDPVEGGEIRIDGRPVAIRHPQDALAAGIVLVPEDRKQEGLVMTQSVAFNVALPWVGKWIRCGMLDRGRRREIVNRAVRHFAARVSDIEQPVDSLSGGNQQKVLVGRWMEERPAVLILDEPTRGVDVGAREEIFTLIGSLVESGMAVLLISSDLSEVLNVSHRIALYRDGSILRIGGSADFTMEEILAALTGAGVHADG